MDKFFLRVLLAGLIAVLAACGEDSFVSPDGTFGTGPNGTGTTPTVSMGSGTGVTFTAGALNILDTTLSAGGATTISVTLQDSTGALYQQATTISFSSNCSALGTATLDASVSTSTGIATSNYVAQGCTPSDTITATATLNGATQSASGTITIAAAALGAIQFVSADPVLMALQGTGGESSSTVQFKVFDTSGGVVSGQDVTFALNTTVGGLTLTPASAVSDANGLVQTVVQAGTIPTAVVVTASTTTLTGVVINTQSSLLSITTGIPDQDSFTLSASVLNPEAYNYVGVVVNITARLADRFNNPVADGTVVNFNTEGGAIVGTCATTAGACSVDWTSQNPLPCGQVSGGDTVFLDTAAGPNVCTPTNSGVDFNDFAPTFLGLGQPYGGRATIVATAVGEESFIDVNGNGIFDDLDFHTDLPEAFRDDDEDGSRAATELFLDFDEGGDYDAADGAFNGVLCSRTVAPLCSPSATINVRRNIVLVMSGSFASISVPAGVTVANGGTYSGSIVYSDIRNQPMPFGTSASIGCTLGSVPDGASHTMGSTNANGPTAFAFTYQGPSSTAGDTGVCTVTVTTPNGNISTASFGVTESAP